MGFTTNSTISYKLGANSDGSNGNVGAFSISRGKLYIGEDGSRGSNLSGAIAEIIVFFPQLSATQRSKTQGYLKGKYGLTLAN